MTQQRVLVTGSSGYLGGHLVRRLLRKPDTVVYGLSRTPDPQLSSERFMRDDIRTAALASWLEEIQPDVIFHAVGVSPKTPFEEQLLVHAEGTRRLLQTVVDGGLHTKIVVIGSAAEYGLQDEPVSEDSPCKPEGEYGIAKHMQTQIAQLYAKRFHLPVMIARIFNVYGHTQRHLVVASLAAQLAQAEATFPEASELRVQNLRSWRDFIHVDDAVEALFALSAQHQAIETHGQIYNVASGHSTAISTVLDLLLTQTKLSSEQQHQVQLKIEGTQHEDISWASIEKIRAHTGWEPKLSLAEGLKQELQYWREQLALSAVTT